MTKEFFQLANSRYRAFRQKLSAEESIDSDNLIGGAYAIQSELHAIRLKRGDELIGYKVGCISETIQSSLNIHEPIFGRLYASERFESSVELELEMFDGLAIEGELAVTLDCSITELANRDFTPNDVVKNVFPVIELHHHRPENKLTAANMIAQNAIHAGFVWNSNLDSSTQVPDQLSIAVNRDEVACAVGSELDATVCQSLHWLAESLKIQHLQAGAGMVILCGSVAPLIPLTRGGHVEVKSNTDQSIACIIQ